MRQQNSPLCTACAMMGPPFVCDDAAGCEGHPARDWLWGKLGESRGKLPASWLQCKCSMQQQHNKVLRQLINHMRVWHHSKTHKGPAGPSLVLVSQQVMQHLLFVGVELLRRELRSKENTTHQINRLTHSQHGSRGAVCQRLIAACCGRTCTSNTMRRSPFCPGCFDLGMPSPLTMRT